MPHDLRRAARDFGLAMDRTRAASDEVALVKQRIHAQLGERQRAIRLRLMIPAGMAAAALALWWILPSEPAWSVSNDPADCASLSSDSLLSSSGCMAPVTVSQNGDRIELSPDSSVVLRGKHEVQMGRGKARFTITPRKGQRFRVRVAVGTIEVIGTEFRVWQDADQGGVEVQSGTVALKLDSGGTELLHAKTAKSWTNELEVDRERLLEPEDEEPEKPETVSSAPKKRRRQGPSRKEMSKRRIKELLSHQFQLRAQRRFDDALRELRTALADSAFSRQQKARLSLEIGRVLEQQGARAAACQHWRRHARTFGKSSLDTDAARFLASCQ